MEFYLILDFYNVNAEQKKLVDFKLSPCSLHPALEDGTDTGFRNVGQLQLQYDAGERPKRTYTKRLVITLILTVTKKN
jgi:hypothetical protein